MEKENQLFEAKKKYEFAIKLSNSKNERAVNALKRISLMTNNETPKSKKFALENSFCNSNASSSIIEVINLSDESDTDLNSKKKKSKNRFSLNSLTNQYQLKKESNFHSESKKLNEKSKYLQKKKYSLPTNNNTKNNFNSTVLNSSSKIESENRKKLQEMEAFIAQLKRSN